MPKRRSATQLRDHVLQTLPDLFSPAEALCTVSAWVLFSSSSFAIKFSNNCLIVYLIAKEKSTGKIDQKTDICRFVSVKFHKAGSDAVESGNFFKRRGGIGLQPLGKTAIMKTNDDKMMEERP